MVGDGPPVHCWRAVAVGRQHFVHGISGSRGRRHASQTRRGVDVCHPVAGGIWCLDGNPQALAPGGNRAFDWRLYDPEFDVAFVSQTRWIVGHGVCAPVVFVAFVAVVVQIILGGWVSSNYAALACYDFPSCDGTYTPNIDLQQGFNIFQSVGPNYLGGLMTNEARMAIHWVHRIGAIVVLLVVGGLVIQTVKQAAVIGYVLLAVLVTQITLGILNVVWVLPLLNATAHNTVGALLLLVLVTINFAPRLRIVQS